MRKQTRLFALLFFLFPVLQLAAQVQKPVPAVVKQAQESNAEFFEAILFDTQSACDVSAARFAQGAQFLRLDQTALLRLLGTQPKNLSLYLPYRSGGLWIDLVRTDLLTADFKVETDLRTPANYQTGLHYRGVLRGSDGSLAALSFFPNEVMGFVSDTRFNNLILGKVQEPDNKADYMLYSDQEMAMDNPFACLVEDAAATVAVPLSETGPVRNEQCLRVCLEADHLLFANRSGLQPTIDYLSGLFNQIATLYADEGIQMALSSLYIWESPDPYDKSDAQQALEQFAQRRAGVKADLVHLVALGGTEPMGTAVSDALCAQVPAAGYSNILTSYSDVPTFSWAVQVIAHEMGHNLGARHTQWCGWPGGPIDNCYSSDTECSNRLAPTNGNTVMSYCAFASNAITFKDGFGLLPGDLLRNNIRQSACVGPVKMKTTANAPGNTKSEESIDRSNPTTEMTGEELLTLTPNPARERVNIGLHFSKELTARVNLLDMIGRPVQTQTVNLKSGSINLEINALPKGVYLVQVISNDQILATKRLIKE